MKQNMSCEHIMFIHVIDSSLNKYTIKHLLHPNLLEHACMEFRNWPICCLFDKRFVVLYRVFIV